MLYIYYNGTLATTFQTDVNMRNLYYKAGNYCQTYVGLVVNGVTEDPTDACIVYLTKLKIYDVTGSAI